MTETSSATLNATYTNEYFDIIDSLQGDFAGRCQARAYMRGSTAIVHHRVVEASYVPRLFDNATYLKMKRTAETAHRILVKTIEHYLACPEYREKFDFDDRLKELILLPRGYDSVLPFARVDTFLNEDTLNAKFCEFNGDGSSGMNENREISNSLINSPAFTAFTQNHRVETCELFDAWVEKFISIYSTYVHRVEEPRFAICDYLENGVVDEFCQFADLFEKRGIECVVADVRSLKFDGSQLTTEDGKRINAIWRRCVTNDVLDYWDDSQDLIEAVRAEKVALIGSFAGHIVHDKQIFEVLHDQESKTFLTEEEYAFVRETIPFTSFLDSSKVSLDEIRATKDAWIIKPTDHYGADNVYAGCFVDQNRWEELIDAFADERAGYPFIVQSYITPFKTRTLPPDEVLDSKTEATIEDLSTPEYYNNLNGLYLYDGTFQGVFSRLGPLPTISKDMKGITAATIWVDRDTEANE